MKQKNQKITIFILVLGTLLLGITTLIISLQLQNRQTIVNLPPRAAEEGCRVSFTVTPNTEICELTINLVQPTSTPSGTPTIIPTTTPTRTPTATMTPVATATPNPQCGTACSANNQCPTDHSCGDNDNYDNICVLTICNNNPSLCNNNGCSIKPTSTPTRTPTTTATPIRTATPGACNGTCSTNANCANNLICSNGFCRNPECTEQPNCACYFVPTPQVPVTGTGTTLAGIGVIAGGIILLLLGLVF